jgi:hypothetical protein
MAMVTTTALAQSLSGLTFPSTKEQCLAYARRHNASPEILALLGRLPDTNFRSIAEVWTAIGEIS